MKWIKVTESLPENRQEVIIWWGGNWERAEFAGGAFYVEDRDGDLTIENSGVEYWAAVNAPDEVLETDDSPLIVTTVEEVRKLVRESLDEWLSKHISLSAEDEKRLREIMLEKSNPDVPNF